MDWSRFHIQFDRTIGLPSNDRFSEGLDGETALSAGDPGSVRVTVPVPLIRMSFGPHTMGAERMPPLVRTGDKMLKLIKPLRRQFSNFGLKGRAKRRARIPSGSQGETV